MIIAMEKPEAKGYDGRGDYCNFLNGGGRGHHEEDIRRRTKT